MHQTSFILSTGRTGTQFFEYFINNYTSNATCLHEPKPSRRFKFYSNLYLQKKLSASFIARQYQKCRKSIYQNLEIKNYIESNNFLFGCVPAITTSQNIKVLHLVRKPEDYIISHLKHGFWKGHKRFFAKYIPYWLEKIDLKKKNDPIKILALRWNYVNSVISSYKQTNDYLLVRFEDLFSKDVQIARETLSKVNSFLELELKNPDNFMEALNKKQNVGKKTQVKNERIEPYMDYIYSTCKELMQQFNY